MIYLDHAATTPLRPEVWEAMQPYWLGPPGNPASAHAAGRRSRRALEDAREQVAALLGSEPGEVIFTSGATEANNLALFGLAGEPPARIAASPVEHSCVVEPLAELARRGFAVEYLPVDAEGRVNARPACGARLVTIQAVNHETGAITDLAAVRQLLGPEPLIHTDAAQAVGKMAVRFRGWGVTALTLSAHKFGGPMGAGALLLRKQTRLTPLFHGGHQQQGRRPGTEPIALAVGLARALELAESEREKNWAQAKVLRAGFLDRLQSLASPIAVNGPSDGVPHIVNVSFPGCVAQELVIALDLAGVACSTGSACSSGSLLPSPVLRAMGVPGDRLRSAMRFSLSASMSGSELDEAAQRIARAVKASRAASAMVK